MLFNRDNKGAEELKAHIGFYYKKNNFDNIKVDVILAEESITELVGQPVYDLVNDFYNSPSSGSGSGGGTEILSELLEHMQLPIALLAYSTYSLNADISHEDNGRKLKINKEHESIPWQWQIDSDNAATIKKYNKTTDRLIAFLEKNEDEISEWKDSDSQKLARSMFVRNATMFNDNFPIDKSRAFYLRILPFMRIVEQREIKATLGLELFNELKTAIKEDSLTSDQKDLVLLINNAIAPLTMALAVKRLSIQLLPEGVIQNYTNGETKARQVAPADLVSAMVTVFSNDGNIAQTYIQEYLRKQAADEAGEFYEPQEIQPLNSVENKYFTT